MDHCCDSMTTFLITGAIGSVVGFDRCIHFAVLWFMVIFPFFATIWEENLTHYFYLPIVNGVSEGALVTSGVIATTGYLGNQIFHDNITLFGNEYRMLEIAVLGFFLTGFTFFLIM